MPENKLQTAWVRGCVFYGRNHGEYIYRVRNFKNEVTEGFAGRNNVTLTHQPPVETTKQLRARLKSGDITFSFWCAVESRIIKEKDGILTIVMPDNQVIELSETRVLTRDKPLA